MPIELRPFNARSLALSVLLGSHPPELPAAALVTFGELFGIAPGTMRTALSRLAAAGDVAAEAGRYRLTERLLARQHAQDVGRADPAGPWHGEWHLVVAADDQRRQADRRAFRATLANHRFGELRPDIWLRPANLPAPPATSDMVVVTAPPGGRSPAELVRHLWDLPALAAECEALLARLDELDTTSPGPDPIPAMFVGSAAVVRYLRAEPLLPPELTPPRWPVPWLRRRYDRIEADLQARIGAFLGSIDRARPND